MYVDPMSRAIGSIFLENSMLTPDAVIPRRRISGVLSPDDLFDDLQIVLIIDPPAAPVTANPGEQPLALPAEKGRPGNIEPVADLLGFIYSRVFALDHCSLTVVTIDTVYSKYSYYDSQIISFVKNKVKIILFISSTYTI